SCVAPCPLVSPALDRLPVVDGHPSSFPFVLPVPAAPRSWVRQPPSPVRLSAGLPPPVRLSLPGSFSADSPAGPILSAAGRIVLAVPSHPRRHPRLRRAGAVLLYPPSTSPPLHPSAHNSSPCVCSRSPAASFRPRRHGFSICRELTTPMP